MNRAIKTIRLCKAIAWASSLASVVFGMLVITHYHTPWKILLFDAGSTAPSHLSGFLFIMSGVGLASLSSGKLVQLQKLIGVSYYFFALIYYFIPDVIPNYFTHKNSPVISSYTTLAFIFIGTVFLLNSKKNVYSRLGKQRLLLIIFLSIVLFLLSICGILAHYKQEIAAFIFPKSKTIAFATSVLLLIFSIGLIARNVALLLAQPYNLKKQAPYIVFLFFITCATCLSVGIWVEKALSLQHLASLQGSSIKKDLIHELKKNAFNLQTIADESRILSPFNEKTWNMYADLNLRANPDWTALEIYDKELKKLHSQDSSKEYRNSLESYLQLDEFSQKIKATSSSQVAMMLVPDTSPKDLPVMIIFSNIYTKGIFDGGVAAAIDLKKFIAHAIFIKELDNYMADIRVEQLPLLVNNFEKETSSKEFQQILFSTYGLNWSITVGPTRSFLYSQSTLLLWMSSVGGLIFAFSAAGIVALWQKSQYQFSRIKEIQSVLIENKRKLDITLGSAAIGTWRWDIKKDLFELDKQSAINFGLKEPATSIKLKDIRNWIIEEDREKFDACLQSALTEKKFKSMELRVKWPDGTVHILQSKGKIFFSPDGTPEYVIGAGWDASEIFRTRQILFETQERFKAFVDTINEWIWEMDTKMKFTYSNPNIQLLLGYTPEEIFGKDFSNYINEDDRAACSSVFENALVSKHAVFNTLSRWKHKDGSERWIETNYTPFFSSGHEIMGFRAASRDISERKKIESLKNDFISNVSHELRTPLTSIYGSLGLLIGKYQSEHSSKVRELLDIAFRNAGRLLNLINQLLNMQRIERGKIDYHLTVFPIKTMITEAVKLNQSIAEGANITIRHIEPLSEAVVNADFDRLIEVMTNLISNAIKFSFPNGIITISTEETADVVRVVVKDEGKGIPQNFQPQIFQRFAQADPSKTLPGAGLGLNICKTIIEQLKGSIHFLSESGKGSTFYFELPKQKKIDEPEKNIPS